MKLKEKKWEILGGKLKKSENSNDIVKILLANRGLETEKKRLEFLNPKDPLKIKLSDIKINKDNVDKTLSRLIKAKKENEKIIVYGDYDADGVTATAILWECLYKCGFDVLPYIPGRFTEGYGLNTDSINKLKKKYKTLGLIFTVDNGIVARDAVDTANELGIDVIISDHHQKESKLPGAYSIIHTTEVGGAGVAWFIAREIANKFDKESFFNIQEALGLAAIGTVSDQIPLIGANRSIVKKGISELRKTKRIGILELFKIAAIDQGEVNTYTIGFGIAPRINAMGRLSHAMDSLRLVCTNDTMRGHELAVSLEKTNKKRQTIVEDVMAKAREKATNKEWIGAIVIAGKDFHEGVVGLAASKLVEEFYRPAIVFSEGDEISKGSARSIPGFNIITAIKKLDNLLLASGGHPMAAGLSLNTKDLKKFSDEFEKLTDPLLPDEALIPIQRIDLELDFSQLNWDLVEKLRQFAPTGSGNPTPSFATRGVTILDVKTVGREAKHLKLKLQNKDCTFDAIAFGKGDMYIELMKREKIDVCFNFEENIWNGVSSMQLKVRDIR